MGDGTSRPYQYQKLEQDEKIRLLAIHPGMPGEKVRARLRSAAFDEDVGCVIPKTHFPPDHPRVPGKERVLRYDAVSWAWGDPSRNAEIEIMDDKGDRWTFGVSQKLEEALQAVRSENSVRTIWIDAVCINQNDSEEKSHQVPMMDRIYGLADRVCIWLGPISETHDAKDAFKLLRKLRKDMDYRKTIDASNSEQLRTLSGMMRRDWFSRRWIIQEIALAKKAVVFCDKESMDWIEFAQAIELFVEGESRTKLADNKTLMKEAIPHYWKNVSALGAARLVRDISAIRRLAPNTRSRAKHELLMSLEEIVCRLETFKTSKPHDTIYAYLALAKDTVPVAHVRKEGTLASKLLQAAKAFDMTKIAAKAFFVNYTRPYAEVCSQFIQFAIKQQSSRETALDILCRPWSYEEEDHVARRELGLPKWVATIACAPLEMTTHDSTIGLYRRNGDAFVGLPGKPIYNAADSTPVNDKILKFVKLEGIDGKPVHSLMVTGFVLDEIDIIKDKVTCDAVVPEEWLTLGKWLDTKLPPPDPLWKTLVGDRGLNGTGCPLSYPLCCAKALKASHSVRNLETSAITSHPKMYESFVAGFCSRVQEVVVNRRLIMTRKMKRLGLVSGRENISGPSQSESIQKGDLICILHGCSVPVVLRKVKKSPEELEHEEDQYTELTKYAVRMVDRKWDSILERRGRWRRRRRRIWASSAYWIAIIWAWMQCMVLIGALGSLWFQHTPWILPYFLPSHSELPWPSVTIDIKMPFWVTEIASEIGHWIFQRIKKCPEPPHWAENSLLWISRLWSMLRDILDHIFALGYRLLPFLSRGLSLLSLVHFPDIRIHLPRLDFMHIFHQPTDWTLEQVTEVFRVVSLSYPTIYTPGIRVGFGALVLMLLLARVLGLLLRYIRRARSGKRKKREGFETRFERAYYYEFWGECYIDGMMDGYAVRVQNDSVAPDADADLKKIPNITFELR